MGRVWKRLGVALLTAGLLVAFVGSSPATLLKRAEVLPSSGGDELLTVLVLGSDVGPPARPGDLRRGRADAIHLVAVDTKRLRATIVDIPRDSYVGGTKINAHLALGGPDAMVDAVEDLSGVEIDHYAVTSFKGLRGIVDSIGGVDVDVAQPMRDDASGSDFAHGRQRLDGREALAFTRDRTSLSGGDFARTRHQGDMLRALHREARAVRSDLPALTGLVAAVSRNVVTDVPPDRMLRLGLLAVRMEPSSIRQVSLQGSIGTNAAGSVVFLRAGDAFRDLRRGRVGR